MICTAARGGMLAVVEGYLADGLFSRWNVVLLSPHFEGGILRRLAAATKEYSRFLGMLLMRRVSLVHCHAAMKGSFWRKSAFALTARLFGVPVIFHLHGSEMKTFVEKQYSIFQILIAWILRKQSVVVVLSQSWMTYVSSISPKANIVILPNYVVLPHLNSVEAASSQSIELLFLGVIGIRKGVYDLLPAFRDAVSQIPNLHLVIGGNGEEKRARELASDLGIDRSVDFAGWVSGDKKIDLLSKADIYVLPSYNEGLPVSLLEAMSWRMPVITTRVGGIPELVRDGEDGVLIEAGNQSELTDAILKLARNTELRYAMGQAARERVRCTFSRDAVLPKLESIYGSLISTGSVG
jgi:glycosyltransferase involved in cell wall biosynthesis